MQCNQTVKRGRRTEARWVIDPYEDTLDSFRRKLESAETCPDFAERPRRQEER